MWPELLKGGYTMKRGERIRILRRLDRKFRILMKLEKQGVIRELCPVPTADYRNTAYWHYEVLNPDRLPESLKSEYERIGELRW